MQPDNSLRELTYPELVKGINQAYKAALHAEECSEEYERLLQFVAEVLRRKMRAYVDGKTVIVLQQHMQALAKQLHSVGRCRCALVPLYTDSPPPYNQADRDFLEDWYE